MAIHAYYELNCDATGCWKAYPAPYLAIRSANAIRRAAEQDGWQVPPARGKGSRTIPYRCPECRGT